MPVIGPRLRLVVDLESIIGRPIREFDVFPGRSREVLTKTAQPDELVTRQRDVRRIEEIEGHRVRIFDQEIPELSTVLVDVTQKWTVDVGYSHLFISDTEINNGGASSSNATLIGSYESSVDIFSAQATFNF